MKYAQNGVEKIYRLMKFKEIKEKYNELNKNLETLQLTKMLEMLPSIIDDSVKNNVPLVDSLYKLTELEIKFRDDRARKINITVSHFPFNRTIKEFDFDYQPSINRKEIEDKMNDSSEINKIIADYELMKPAKL